MDIIMDIKPVTGMVIGMAITTEVIIMNTITTAVILIPGIMAREPESGRLTELQTGVPPAAVMLFQALK